MNIRVHDKPPFCLWFWPVFFYCVAFSFFVFLILLLVLAPFSLLLILARFLLLRCLFWEGDLCLVCILFFGFWNFAPGEKTHTLILLVFFEEYWESFLDTKQRGSTHVTDNGYNQTRERNMSTRPLMITMVDLWGVYGRYHYLFRYLCIVLALKRQSAPERSLSFGVPRKP